MDALKTPRISSTDTEAAPGGGGRIRQLSSMRIAACVGIVALHTVFAANEYFAASLTPTENLLSRMTENNMMWAVPVFLMVTGALQLDPARTLTLRKLYGRYVLRVLLALIACCLLFRAFDMIMDGEGFSLPGLMQAFGELVTARCWGHLWYLYLLLGLYVLLPFYRMIADRSTEGELIYLCGAYLLFVSLIPLVESFGIPVGFYISETIIYPLYLFLGYMIRFSRLRIGRGMGWILLVCSTGGILALDYLKYGLSLGVPEALFGYASPLVIAQALGVFVLIWQGGRGSGKGCRSLFVLDGCTFGIYLIHMVFVRALFRYIGWNPYTVLHGFSLILVIGGIFVLSLGLTWLLKKIPAVRWVL